MFSRGLLVHKWLLLQAELDKQKFFAKPKLALDCVGGTSCVRLSDALAQVSCLCTCKQPQGDTQTLLEQRSIYACQYVVNAVCILVCKYQCNMRCALCCNTLVAIQTLRGGGGG